MPNHITNKITIISKQERINEILETIKHDEHGLGSIDFNKIIPMPDNIFRGDIGKKEKEFYGNYAKNWTWIRMINIASDMPEQANYVI